MNNEIESKLLKILTLEPCLKISDINSISPHQNLLTTGVLDSLSFINFIANIENEMGIEIDFSSVELSEFNSIAKIASIINSNSTIPD